MLGKDDYFPVWHIDLTPGALLEVAQDMPGVRGAKNEIR